MSAIDALLKRWNVSGKSESPRTVVRQLLNGMSSVPYENLTKLLSDEERRSEKQVAREHLEYGAGGTCFSLVRLFLTLARRMNLDAKPILADRSYGPNTHCAAVIRGNDGWILADPGYLIHEPVELHTEQKIELPHTTLRMSDEGKVFTVYPNGHEKFRYQLHEKPVSDDEFEDLWISSFDWDMMNQLVVNRLVDGTHFYLRDTYLHENTRDNHEQTELESHQLIDQICQMGIDESIARAAAVELNLAPDDSSGTL